MRDQGGRGRNERRKDSGGGHHATIVSPPILAAWKVGSFIHSFISHSLLWWTSFGMRDLLVICCFTDWPCDLNYN